MTRNPFHRPYLSSIQTKQIANLLENAFELYEDLIEFDIKNREMSMALDKLEECIMWATKAISFNT